MQSENKISIGVINGKRFLFEVVFFLLVYRSIFRYFNKDWELNREGARVIMMSGDMMITVMTVACILLLCWVFWENRYPKTLVTYCAFILLGIGLIWTVISFSQYGRTLFYENGTPIYLMEFGIFFLFGGKDEYWSIVEKWLLRLAVLYLALSIYYTVDILARFPLYRMAGGPMMQYLYFTLFLLALEIGQPKGGKKRQILIMILLAVCVVLGVLTTSRSWMIQALFLMACYYFSFSELSAKQKIIRIIIGIAALLIVYNVLIRFFGDSTVFVLKRFEEDTRTSQYEQFFSQVDLKSIILGGGMNARYNFNGQSYAYFDNQFLYWAFRFGIVAIVPYVLPFIYVMYSWLKKKRRQRVKGAFVPLLMWLAAMGGLSIYFNLTLDIVNMIILMAVGHYSKLAVVPSNE